MIHIRDILVATKGKLIAGDDDIELKGISIDSRKIKEGDLFIPIIGERFDGHRFIGDAFKFGADAVLSSKEIDISESSGKSIIMVEDTLKALQDISKYFLSKVDIPVVAVTGSTGKTTTKEMIYSVLSQEYRVLKNEGNFNNHIGLPLTLLNIEEEHEMIVLEMGMSNRGEIHLLSKIATPEVGVITNIGICHIESLGSKEEIFNAKMEISNHMDDTCILILNGDDEYLSKVKSIHTRYKKVFTGLNENNDIYVTEIKDLGHKGVAFNIIYKDKDYDFKLNVPGIHNVNNALLAIAVGIHYNIPFSLIKTGLSSFHGNKMRLNIVDTKEEIKIINDCYNANPDSMKAALSVLEKVEAKRRIAVLGDMLELGEYSESCHKEVGRMVFEKNVDILITVGHEAENIVKGAIISGFPKEKTFALADNITAKNIINIIKRTGDAILIKASRGMKMEEIVQYLQERR
ncbi:UDP-N-acetylmuramoyl-tripeptide--D-alanyl-D-alanine ligase [Paramaledivibacter caminithermalis]|jgi:UDP-N-acetylmuramoyl-tripeptide--D-alanyl-D-alanine ligase|uniref:UDP-N-acetylmuramoyl-tripeptide--D-alanyl-D-alanine ligase n=1 Tax=Paramaledivibacter caminithermalis (strain DSM 15212 / CIP 107654 / DViRD3) TaxID=1121301 RepID=A0A1M6S206_PARC5|nr:UDP-N-acetylmuramoyl-tripeptide--D-alanyl-D-alanine ligase [Paramaledivibacter caminithermalis]SHK38649.1 UDP-N-acetylmuramoyl-tripeptide--D-alanyl-D-alanine ligase [Paramaledivibacter caminithermalis DSM 15212]